MITTTITTVAINSEFNPPPDGDCELEVEEEDTVEDWACDVEAFEDAPPLLEELEARDEELDVLVVEAALSPPR